MPVLERISEDYEGEITFLAIGARGDAGATAEKAAEWIPSGRVLWAFDEPERLWGVFGARGTPTSVVLSSEQVMLGGWAGEIGEAGLRDAFDRLVAAG